MKKTGVLLINLGTPQSTRVADVRRYLKEFLSDPRVIDIPSLPRWLLVNCLILPFRPKQSAQAYQKIWCEQGSPLLYYSQALTEKVQRQLGTDYQVELAMRYGKPSIQAALTKLVNCNRLIVLPLFPQYSSAASGSAIAKTLALIQNQTCIPSITIIHEFYQQDGFIQAFADKIKPAINNNSDYILFSYHGLPERQISKAGCQYLSNDCQAEKPCPAIDTKNKSCYRAQCYATTTRIAQKLNLSKTQYGVSFQSRLGRTPWIKPYTDLLLPKLYQQGVRRLTIVSPSFVADCLETLEELNIRAREQWLELGGEHLEVVPCLNADDSWVSTITDLIR